METDALLRRLKAMGSAPTINGPVVIIAPENVVFGRDVCINPRFYADAAGGITFGNHVHVGQNVRILTQNHHYDQPECLPYDKVRILAAVTIGDCVWIGDNASIVPGVNVGEGAVIAMASVVTKDVPALAVVGGAPAKVLKMRNAETYWRLKREGKFLNWPMIEPAPQSLISNKSGEPAV